MPTREQYKKIDKQKVQEYHKQWRMKNQNKIREYYKNYRFNNLHRIKKLQRNWYLQKKGLKHQPVIEYKKVVIDFD